MVLTNKQIIFEREADGERVLDLAGLELSLEDGLLNADLTLKNGETGTVRLSLRSGEVEA